MRLVIISEGYSRNMGYIENQLPKFLVLLGHEVHVVTSTLQAGYRNPTYEQTYGEFLGPRELPPGTEQVDGYTLHRLPYYMFLGHPILPGLVGYLRRIQPDVVQVHAAASWIAMQTAVGQGLQGYRLFTGAHQTASVFDPSLKNASRWRFRRFGSDLRRALPGRFVASRSQKCYAATLDCARVAEQYYGVPSTKIEICPLGVDTEIFSPITDFATRQQRQQTRAHLEISENEIVCIYTGRFSEAKNPLCLAVAVATLRSQGKPFRGLFVGGGDQRNLILETDGCIAYPFVPSSQLADLYRAADIAVWPTQESLSMLDAAACGLPLVVNDRMQARERIDGNGITYREGDPNSLAAALASIEDQQMRERLGSYGAEKMAREFGWGAIAQRRLSDYQESLIGSKHHNGEGSERN